MYTHYSKPKSTYLNGKLRRLNIKQKKKYCQAVIYTSKDKFAFLSALFLHYWWCIEASTNFTCVSTEKVWQIKLDAKSRVFSQIKRTKKKKSKLYFWAQRFNSTYPFHRKVSKSKSLI